MSCTSERECFHYPSHLLMFKRFSHVILQSFPQHLLISFLLLTKDGPSFARTFYTNLHRIKYVIQLKRHQEEIRVLYQLNYSRIYIYETLFGVSIVNLWETLTIHGESIFIYHLIISWFMNPKLWGRIIEFRTLFYELPSLQKEQKNEVFINRMSLMMDI